ncbi:MAG: nuclear transport factor 2 family protein [Arenimonas sp.]|nr:nuclear transport factor 2 family protein [Arenimonas sp.]
MSVIDRWHELVKTKDLKALDAILADDAVFESPVVHTPQAGKALTLMYLTGALHTLNNETFRYLNEWHGDRSAVLEFACEIEGIAVNGVDIVSWNEAGKITHFKVMIRPLKAINLVHRMMGELLARAG